jgi:hypothetical protein
VDYTLIACADHGNVIAPIDDSATSSNDEHRSDEVEGKSQRSVRDSGIEIHSASKYKAAE